jgi:antitoxin component YwqK of YwqJK toxin-antitoxin module
MENDKLKKMEEFITNNVYKFLEMELQVPDGHYKSSKREFTIVNGKLHGEYKEWWENGQPCVHCTYKEGKLEGERKVWYKNGQLIVHCFYEKGLIHGEFKRWYSNGQPWEHITYKEGQLLTKKVN